MQFLQRVSWGPDRYIGFQHLRHTTLPPHSNIQEDRRKFGCQSATFQVVEPCISACLSTTGIQILGLNTHTFACTPLAQPLVVSLDVLQDQSGIQRLCHLSIVIRFIRTDKENANIQKIHQTRKSRPWMSGPLVFVPHPRSHARYPIWTEGAPSCGTDDVWDTQEVHLDRHQQI